MRKILKSLVYSFVNVSDSVPRVVVEVAIAFTENALLVPVAAQEV
jgi:hypothetical protein